MVRGFVTFGSPLITITLLKKEKHVEDKLIVP